MDRDLFATANYVEAALWGVVAVVMIVAAARTRGKARRRAVIAAIALAAFGLSDVVEVRTGAWWRPWWLLVWKATCIVILLASLVAHIGAGKRER